MGDDNEIAMKIALAQTTALWTGLAPVSVEPVSLLGMYNQLKAAGHTVRLIHNTNGNGTESIEQVDEYDPGIIGLSVPAISPCRGASYWTEAISRFKERGATVIMGGNGPTFNPQQYASEIQPDVIVMGPGEPIMAEFINYEFDWKALKGTQFFKGMLGGTMLFGLDRCESGALDLDSIGYERDYSLAGYEHLAWPLLQIGCPHHCMFCPGDLPVNYKSPQAAVEEIRYLITQKGALTIWPTGSDFTASAKRSAAIVGALANQDFISDTVFRLEVRMDSFWRSVQKYRKEWERFAASVPYILLNTGIESFQGERRWRMRKDFSEDRAMNHAAVVDYVLEWAQSVGNVGVEGSFIMIDPESTFREFYKDLFEIALRIISTAGRFHLIYGILYNYLDATVGTKSAEMYPHQAGSNVYRNDPRLRLLQVYMDHAVQRDCGEADEKSDGDRMDRDIFLLTRLWEVAHRIETKSKPDKLERDLENVTLLAKYGDFSFFDED